MIFLIRLSLFAEQQQYNQQYDPSAQVSFPWAQDTMIKRSAKTFECSAAMCNPSQDSLEILQKPFGRSKNSTEFSAERCFRLRAIPSALSAFCVDLIKVEMSAQHEAESNSQS